MVLDPRADPPGEDERLQSPRTLQELGHVLGVHVPRRMAQLRQLGVRTKALTGRRPKPKG